MAMSNIKLDECNLNQLHRTIITSIGDMFTRPIQDKKLNRSTLIKGLKNMIKHETIQNYLCFTELVLNDLNLENIDIIGDYISLKKLILRQNCIKDLNALNNLNDLKYLDVSHNCLKRILNFNSPKMLNYVDISNNNIEKLEDLTNFWSLVHLNLSHNVIKNVIGLQDLKFLKYLNLSYNCIKQILSNSLPYSLIEINLSYNDLEHIQFDMSSSMCEILNVSHNKLKLLNFLKNAKNVSVLNIRNNMIDDILQIKYLKSLTNLCILNAENNKFIEFNVHEQILSNNLPIKSIVDHVFLKTGLLQDLDQMEIYSMLKAEKNTNTLTILENLSGKSPISGNKCNEMYSLPMIILVGPPKTRKKYLLNQILTKHIDKFYRAFIYTTNNSCKNKIFKTITANVFNKMACNGEFVFSYQFLGHSYGLNEDQLSKCAKKRKILITFTNLDGALSLKLKGYNPIFVLVLPEDKLLYKQNIYQSIKKYTNHNNSFNTENETREARKKTTGQTINVMDNSNANSNDFIVKSFPVCSLDHTDKIKVTSKDKIDFDDDLDDSILNDPCVIYTNECINNLDIYNNIYEKSSGIFHSLVYVDNSQKALKEMITIMINVYNKYQINKKSETRKQPNKHTIEYIQALHKELNDELFNYINES